MPISILLLEEDNETEWHEVQVIKNCRENNLKRIQKESKKYRKS